MRSTSPWICSGCNTSNNGHLEWCYQCDRHVSLTDPRRRGAVRLYCVPKWIRRHGRKRRLDLHEWLDLDMIGVYYLDRAKFAVRFEDGRVWYCHRAPTGLEVTTYESVRDFHDDNHHYWPFYVQNLGIEQLDRSAVDDPPPVQICRVLRMELRGSRVFEIGACREGELYETEVKGEKTRVSELRFRECARMRRV